MGSGGSIYSYITPGLGEVLPPQKHDKGPFQDEVWQVVMVDNSLNAPYNPATQDYAEDKKYFIHQAGVYQKDPGPGDILDTKPFYSPSLAKHCSGRQCTFAAWGQHAHVPTLWKSSCIYYTRYRDCGDGVMEVTYAVHNYDEKSPGDSFGYTNIPWGGVRATTLRDPHHGHADPTQPSTRLDVHHWGSTGEIAAIQNIKDTGGFTTFAERVEHPAPAAWTNPGGEAYITSGNWQKSSFHSDRDGQYCARVTLSSGALDGAGYAGLLTFTNLATGAVVQIKSVLHFKSGTRMYVRPADGVTAADLTAAFPNPSTITITITPLPFKSDEDNLALSFVYGKNAEKDDSANNAYFSGAVSRGNARVRVGGTSQEFVGGRDFTVFTVNWFPPIKAGYTYYNRQYVISDRFADMDTIAKSWVSETKQGMYFPGDEFASARTIRVFMGGGKYGACLTQACGEQSSATLVCTGKSVPHTGAVPTFAISCGSMSYFGPDPYALSPAPTAFSPAQDAERPYLCNGMSSDVRPTWNLVGYFQSDDCSSVQQASYEEDFCNFGPCPANTYSTHAGWRPGLACTPCPSNTGTSGVTGSIASTACVAASGHSGPNGGTPTACAADTYKSETGAAACTPCPSNTGTADVTGSITSTACVAAAGYTGPNGLAPTACAADTYKSETGAAACTRCGGSSNTGGVTGSSSGTACAIAATTDWSVWSFCSCEDPKDQTRGRTNAGKAETETRPCYLDDPCPGVENAEPAVVELELAGDGLWDYVKDNQEEFKAAMTTDIASTLNLPVKAITDVVARLAAALLSSTQLLADQNVEVTFTILPGSSNTVTPAKLAESYQSAINNGTANFSSTEEASGITMKAKVTGVKETTVVGSGSSGIAVLAMMMAVPCFVCLFCLWFIKRRRADKIRLAGDKVELDTQTSIDKKQSKNSPVGRMEDAKNPQNTAHRKDSVSGSERLAQHAQADKDLLRNPKWQNSAPIDVGSSSEDEDSNRTPTGPPPNYKP
jgi:hypothetical protein